MAKYLVKKICTSGDCVEEFYSFSGRERLTRVQRKRGASDLRKVDSNFKSAVRRLARTLNCNFTHGDLLVTLDYADIEGKTREDFNKDCELMLRRLRYQCRKDGTEFKWVWVFGEISTHTGLPSRPHHHIVMPRFAYETVVKNWTHGSVNYRLLQNQKDYTKLALYLLRNVDKNEPFLVDLSLELTNKVFTKHERECGNELMFEANRLAYASTATKLAMVQLVDRGAISLNEYRETLNLAPVEGGDIRVIRREYTELSQLGKEEGGTANAD